MKDIRKTALKRLSLIIALNTADLFKPPVMAFDDPGCPLAKLGIFRELREYLCTMNWKGIGRQPHNLGIRIKKDRTNLLVEPVSRSVLELGTSRIQISHFIAVPVCSNKGTLYLTHAHTHSTYVYISSYREVRERTDSQPGVRKLCQRGS
jgi:hypothetical protein